MSFVSFGIGKIEVKTTGTSYRSTLKLVREQEAKIIKSCWNSTLIETMPYSQGVQESVNVRDTMQHKKQKGIQFLFLSLACVCISFSLLLQRFIILPNSFLLILILMIVPYTIGSIYQWLALSLHLRNL